MRPPISTLCRRICSCDEAITCRMAEKDELLLPCFSLVVHMFDRKGNFLIILGKITEVMFVWILLRWDNRAATFTKIQGEKIIAMLQELLTQMIAATDSCEIQASKTVDSSLEVVIYVSMEIENGFIEILLMLRCPGVYKGRSIRTKMIGFQIEYRCFIVNRRRRRLRCCCRHRWW